MTGLLVPYLGAFIPANVTSVEMYQVMTQFSTVDVTPQVYVQETTPIFTWTNLLWSVYILGGMVVFSRFLYGLNRIYTIYKNADITPLTHYTLVQSDRYHLPFSFFHFVFISKRLPLNSEIEKVLRHEELHANQWHSLDIIFIELLQVFFWFNPILIFYKNALRQSHEYLADAYVTQDHNKSSYGQLLLQQSTSGLEVALANQFFHSQIKKRITMMYKEKSKRSAMVKYLAVVPVLLAMLLIFSSNQMKAEYSKEELTSNTAIENLIIVQENGDYFIEDIKIKTELLPIYFDRLRSEKKNLILEVNSLSHSRYTADLLDIAYENDVLVTIKPVEKINSIIPTTNSNNFDGRKIIKRNWHNFHSKYRSIKCKITVKAEANANGDIIYVEIVNDKTTIDNKVILKDALKAAKGFKIEKDNKNSFGEIVFNQTERNINQGYIYDEDQDIFNFDREIKLGEQIPKGSVIVKVKDKILVEGEDYTINYKSGTLTLAESYLGNEPVNISFEENQSDPIFKVVEEMPRFPGCEDIEGTTKDKEECAQQKMLEFIYSNLKYPVKARDENVEGICVVQFVIEKDGSVSGAKLVRDIGADCGVETMNVVNNFPKWTPGKQKGKSVRVLYTLPVKFKLESSSDDKTIKKHETVHVVGFGESNAKAKKESLNINTNATLEGGVLKVSQEMPRFPGCEDIDGTIAEKEECAKHKMLEYVYRNIKYPKEARTKGIDGMSVIRMVIEKNGTVTNITKLRDPGAGTGDEVARIVREMPTWIPGKENGKAVRVRYTLPVKFQLENENKPKSPKVANLLKGKTSGVNINGDRKIRLKTSNSNGPDPLFVIDGVIQKNPALESINPDDIESMNIVKGDKAIEKYGTAGEHGVVEITMKNEKSEAGYSYKTSLKYTAEQFKKITDISYLLKDMGLKEESKSEVLKFSLVKVAEKEDAYIEHSNDGQFNQRILKLISEAKITDRYFFENIVINSRGKEENIGAVSIMIVDGMPGLVRSLIVVNGKKVTSDWMNNINPEYIQKMDVLEGEKMIEKYGEIPHNSVIEITLKPGKNLTKYMIDGKLCGYDFYRNVDKSHIKNERPGTKEEKFIRGITVDLIVVTMKDGYGQTEAYFPETASKDASDNALLDFVSKNVKYSKSALDNNIEGLITVRYTVRENGELTDFKIVKSLGWGLDEEVLKVMDKLAETKGLWTAALLDGKPITTSAILPVKFKLPKSNKLNTIKFSTIPNPSNGIFNVVYQLDRDTPVNLTFYSVDGKVVKRMLNLPAVNNINIDLSSQNLPLIYITLEQEGKTKTIKTTFQN